VRQDIREHKGWIWMGAGVIAVGLYGVVATFQPDDSFGRVLFAGQIAWACSPTAAAPTASTSSAPSCVSPVRRSPCAAPRGH
jgi:hypothetical protein